MPARGAHDAASNISKHSKDMPLHGTRSRLFC